MAGFVSLFSFPFFLQKRKGKLLPSAIHVKKLFSNYSKFRLFILECVPGIKKCSQVKAEALVSTRRGKIRLSCCYPLSIPRITF